MIADVINFGNFDALSTHKNLNTYGKLDGVYVHKILKSNLSTGIVNVSRIRNCFSLRFISSEINSERFSMYPSLMILS